MSAAWHVDRAAIPEQIVPKDARGAFRWTEVREGVAAIQQFASHDVGVARIGHPELVFAVQGKMYPNMNCVDVWAQISSNEFAQLLSAIKTRILDFALELESKNPDAGEALTNKPPIPDEILNPIVHNYFGTVGNIAHGSHGFSQSASIGVQPGDFRSLKCFLLDGGVAERAVAELEEAVHADHDRFGPRVQRWLGKLAITAVDIGKGLSIQVISAALKNHFGLH